MDIQRDCFTFMKWRSFIFAVFHCIHFRIYIKSAHFMRNILFLEQNGADAMLSLRIASVFFAASFLCASSSVGAQTRTFLYDAGGRLVTSVSKVNGVNTITSVAYDKIDNRARLNRSITSGDCQISAYDSTGTDEFTFWSGVNFSGSCSGPVILSYSMVDDTAVSGQHYYSSAGDINVEQPGVSVSSIRVHGIVNSIPSEEVRKFRVIWSLSSGYGVLVDGESIVTLLSSK